MHGTSDTNIQTYPKRAYLGPTRNFSNKSKDSAINNCKDIVDAWVGHSTQGSYMRRFWQKRIVNATFESLTNSDAGDNRVKSTQNINIDTKGFLSYWLRERHRSQKCTLQSGMPKDQNFK